MRNNNEKMVRKERDAVNIECFAGYVHIVHNNAVTSLKSMELVAYPMHAVLMICMYPYLSWMI